MGQTFFSVSVHIKCEFAEKEKEGLCQSERGSASKRRVTKARAVVPTKAITKESLGWQTECSSNKTSLFCWPDYGNQMPGNV